MILWIHFFMKTLFFLSIFFSILIRKHLEYLNQSDEVKKYLWILLHSFIRSFISIYEYLFIFWKIGFNTLLFLHFIQYACMHYCLWFEQSPSSLYTEVMFNFLIDIESLPLEETDLHKQSFWSFPSFSGKFCVSITWLWNLCNSQIIPFLSSFTFSYLNRLRYICFSLIRGKYGFTNLWSFKSSSGIFWLLDCFTRLTNETSNL